MCFAGPRLYHNQFFSTIFFGKRSIRTISALLRSIIALVVYDYASAMATVVQMFFCGACCTQQKLGNCFFVSRSFQGSVIISTFLKDLYIEYIKMYYMYIRYSYIIYFLVHNIIYFCISISLCRRYNFPCFLIIGRWIIIPEVSAYCPSWHWLICKRYGCMSSLSSKLLIHRPIPQRIIGNLYPAGLP